VRALAFVVIEQSAAPGIGVNGGIRTVLWLFGVVSIVAALAIFAKPSGVDSKPASTVVVQPAGVQPTAMQLASVEATPRVAPVQSRTASVVPSDDAPNVSMMTTGTVTQKEDSGSRPNDTTRPSDTTPKFRLASAPATSVPAPSRPDTSSRTIVSREPSFGLASFYGNDSQTASGEKFNARAMTAAHRTLPFGTRVRVTDVATGKSVTVRINDRGPFVAGRIIDVSAAAAETLGIVGRGVAKVRLDVVE
jgi:rare lipoprotein A (peptidoglycan hydrolase)